MSTNLKKDSAELILKQCLHCLQELNVALIEIQPKVNEEDFLDIRGSFASAMANISDVCIQHVYKPYPDLKPFEAD